MDEEIVIEGDQETHHHYEGGGCCEHCAEHAERIAILERELSLVRGTAQEAQQMADHAQSEAIVAREAVAELEQGVEAVAVVAIEALDQAAEEPEEESSDDRTNDPGDGIGPEPETSEVQPITIQVEPEKEPAKKQPGYGFRRGTRR